MGTRADFYVGKGETAEWLGSIAYDGYPDGEVEHLLGVKSEKTWRKGVAALLAKRDDATVPANGWPWPWEDSGTTDFAYSFDGGRVRISRFGCGWETAEERTKRVAAEQEGDADEAKGPRVTFPDMSKRARTAELGSKRSGVLMFSARR